MSQSNKTNNHSMACKSVVSCHYFIHVEMLLSVIILLRLYGSNIRKINEQKPNSETNRKQLSVHLLCISHIVPLIKQQNTEGYFGNMPTICNIMVMFRPSMFIQIRSDYVKSGGK